MDIPLALRECLEFVIGSLITHRDHVSITQSREGNRLLFDVRLHPEDVDTLVGRHGHPIKALRNLLAAGAMRDNLRVALRVDPLDSTPGLAEPRE
ncbi:MAG: KH domain-containing protein [Verrucomicrobiales bacterium]